MRYGLAVGCAVVMLAAALGGCRAGGASSGAGAVAGHDAMLQRFYEESLPSMVSKPFTTVDTLKELKRKEGISDAETARALLKFMVGHPKIGEAILFPLLATVLSADKPAALAEVWIKEGIESSDKDIQSAAEMALDYLERMPGQTPSLEPYRSLLYTAKAEPPADVVVYMYRRNAGEAFEMVAAATRVAAPPEKRQASFGREIELLVAKHVIDQAEWYRHMPVKEGREEANKAAKVEVVKLAAAPEWWVRLYAARTMAENTDLRDAESVARLTKDENETVRAAFRPAKSP